MEKINNEQETRSLESDLEDISNQHPEDMLDSYCQEARNLFAQEESVYNSLKDLAYLQESGIANPINGVRLKVLIGKNKYGNIAQLDGSKGRITDDDGYEIEGISQCYSDGYTLVNIYRTNSTKVSNSPKAKRGKRMYVEIDSPKDGGNFYDPQGFYRKMSDWGYTLVDSKIEII